MKFLKRLSQLLQQFNTRIFLHVAYVVGIGVVSIVGRAIGVKFLDETGTKTNWKTPTGSADSKRMF